VPWLDSSAIRSNRFRPLMKRCFWAFVMACVVLGYCGAQPADATMAGVPVVWVARLATLYYFAFFWLIMPVVGLIEVPIKLPASIAQSALAGPGGTRSHLPVRDAWSAILSTASRQSSIVAKATSARKRR
jgi:hypothetical protein